MKEYRYIAQNKELIQYNINTEIIGVSLEIKDIMKSFAGTVDHSFKPIKAVELVNNISDKIMKYVADSSGTSFEEKNEGFVIITKDDTVTVYAKDNGGSLYGLMSFLQLLDSNGCFGCSCVWGYPNSSIRGVKLFMPGENEIAEFEKFVDMMMYFRHNTLMLEIGGAMEYKRHPEINEAWVKFAKDMSEYSGKSAKIQESFPWRKNSIHSNNGGASFLTQEKIKGLIDYCEKRGIKIIPEVPTASHCDYLVMAHPEIAERCEDPYPDTYCPSNPDSYKLVFDILDEVAEVFDPEIINIGHDEYYSIHICDRCRKRLVSAADIFAEDVLKIYGYLKKKGIKTMLWCDKLLNVLTEDGANFGGALNFVYENWDVNKRLLGVVEPTYTAIEKMPKDLICLNWFWSFGEKYDEDLREFPVIFGNFRGESVISYRKRCGENTSGGICSNWGATLPTYLQRNMIYFSMAYNDMLFWNYEYSAENNSEYEAFVGKCFEKLYQYCHGTSFHSGERVIEIIHGTDKESFYHSFVDGEYTSGEKYVKDYFLGDYEVKYSDSSVYKISVFLGENIGNTELEWYGGMSQSASSSDNPGSRAVRVDCRLCETAGSTLPLRINGKIYYKIAVKDAYPEKHITDIKFVPYKNSGAKVEIYSIEFKDNYSVE